ncbi:MAG: GNAT family N-acetyltransferase [Promethearchaeota archaeon]
MIIRKFDLHNDLNLFHFRKYKTEIIIDSDITTSFFPKEMFLKKFKDHLYLAIEKNHYLGYVYYDIEQEGEGIYCLIYAIHIIKDARGSRIGSKLMFQVLEDCKRNNIEKVVLNVNKDNDKAQNFYQKFGFKIKSYRMVLERKS